jgi:hypothetical protein
MAVNLSPVGGVAGQFFDNNGNPLAGGKIFTYAAGTTTNQATYTSASGAIAHSNPIILDGAGRVPSGEIWLTDGLEYKFVIKDNVDALIGTFDNITGINSNFVNFTNEQEIQTATAGQTVFTLTTMSYQPATNSLSVFVDGVNQYGPGALYAYVETDSTTVTFTTGLHVGAEVKFTTSNINSSAGGDAFNVSYTPPFTGSVTTNVGDKLSENVSATDFGAVGDGITDDTAAIQDALDTGLPIVFSPGTYLCANLTQSVSGQAIYGLGDVILKKNANGVIITSSGVGVEFNNIKFYGDNSSPIYTGNNFESSGNNLRLINCGSRWAYGRAIKATGSHVQIIGTNDIYQTTDATATGYDIEIGVSGTATLYHQLYGIYTSQPTGGIKFIDTGSAVLVGGQIGKLYIAAGTGPAGVNGGMCMGVRVIGTTTVEVSSAVFSGCQFAQDVTFTATATGCGFDASNVLAGSKIVVNNGTQNTIINGKNDGLYEVTGRIYTFPNDSSVRFRKADGTAGAGSTCQFLMTSADNFNLTNFVSGKTIQIEQLGAGDIRLAANGTGGLLTSGANAKIAYSTATPAGGSTGVGLAFGTATNFGVYFGSGAPTLSAAKGSLYLRSDGSTTNDRMYVNTNGSTTWTAVITAA